MEAAARPQGLGLGPHRPACGRPRARVHSPRPRVCRMVLDKVCPTRVLRASASSCLWSTGCGGREVDGASSSWTRPSSTTTHEPLRRPPACTGQLTYQAAGNCVQRNRALRSRRRRSTQWSPSSLASKSMAAHLRTMARETPDCGRRGQHVHSHTGSANWRGSDSACSGKPPPPRKDRQSAGPHHVGQIRTDLCPTINDFPAGHPCPRARARASHAPRPRGVAP